MSTHKRYSIVCTVLIISALVLSFYYLLLLSNSNDIYQLLSYINQKNLFLYDIALPRYIAVILAGASLALSGYLFQVSSRNVLASPSLLGIGSGAHLALVLSIIFFPNIFENYRAFVSLFGGMVVAIIIFGLCHKKSGQIHTIFIGVAISLSLSAIAAMLSIYFENNVSGLFLWGAGDAEQQGWDVLSLIWKYALITILVAFLFKKIIRLYELGDYVIQSLGVPINTTKWIIILIATMLTCFAVTLVGPISFIGLFIPNLLRALGVQSTKLFMVFCIILGAFVLLLADTFSITFEKYFYLNLPLGILTALLGAPMLLWVMLKPNYLSMNDSNGISLYGLGKDINIKKIIIILSLILLSVTLLLIGLSTIFDIINGDFAQKKSIYAFLYYEVYSPRFVLALLTGGALAVSGLFFQSVIQNVLASPEIIGVSQGATCGALIFILLFPQLSWLNIQLAAFIGGIISFLIIIVLSSKLKLSPIQLAIVGISFGALYTAINMGVLAFSGLKSSQILQWLSGSLYGQDWISSLRFAIIFLFIFPLCYLLSPWLTRLSFGHEKSKSLGSNIQIERIILLLLATTLTSAVVATVGMLSFVGLMGPHLARLLGFTKPRELVIISALIGGILVTLADMLIIFAFSPLEIPTGLILPIIGSIYLLWLLLKQKT